MPGERAGFAIWDDTEEVAAFADTVPTSKRQMRNIATKIFIEFNTMGAILSFSKMDQVQPALSDSGKRSSVRILRPVVGCGVSLKCP
jgi:hypothetical protein